MNGKFICIKQFNSLLIRNKYYDISKEDDCWYYVRNENGFCVIIYNDIGNTYVQLIYPSTRNKFRVSEYLIPIEEHRNNLISDIISD